MSDIVKGIQINPPCYVNHDQGAGNNLIIDPQAVLKVKTTKQAVAITLRDTLVMQVISARAVGATSTIIGTVEVTGSKSVTATWDFTGAPDDGYSLYLDTTPNDLQIDGHVICSFSA